MLNKNKNNENNQLRIFRIELSIIMIICVISVLSIIIKTMKIDVVFDPIFKDIMTDIWKEAGVGKASGLGINIIGHELAFGIENISPSKPIILPNDALLKVTYFIPLLFFVLLIPFKKIDKNKKYFISKNIFCATGMILVGLINLLRVTYIGNELSYLLIERAPGLGIRMFTEVNINYYFLSGFLQLLLVFGGLLLFHLTSNVNKYTHMFSDK